MAEVEREYTQASWRRDIRRVWEKVMRMWEGTETTQLTLPFLPVTIRFSQFISCCQTVSVLFK